MNEELKSHVKEDVETLARNFKYDNISSLTFVLKVEKIIDDAIDKAVDNFKKSLTEY